ncbi:hypothetical protein [Macrococcus bovicus]|uniref:hypothetical protein n=1 Tax=Macrococcus bovicus TaxID=69968 RepID=UPI0025A678BF|nr:hypothetical protein [Macrococcus bovicus]WJP96715.1 hypothetical protein QSV55_00315 [Macrococcus bovicus]
MNNIIELRHHYTVKLIALGYVQTVLDITEFQRLVNSLVLEIEYNILAEKDGSVFSGEFWDCHLAEVLCNCFSDYIQPLDKKILERFKETNQYNQKVIDALNDKGLRHLEHRYNSVVPATQYQKFYNYKYRIMFYRFDTFTMDELYMVNKEYIVGNYKPYLSANMDDKKLSDLVEKLLKRQEHYEVT